jgi:hypothetical protein
MKLMALTPRRGARAAARLGQDGAYQASLARILQRGTETGGGEEENKRGEGNAKGCQRDEEGGERDDELEA